jgi:uncharacterized protein (TIGR03000 family)
MFRRFMPTVAATALVVGALLATAKPAAALELRGARWRQADTYTVYSDTPTQARVSRFRATDNNRYADRRFFGRRRGGDNYYNDGYYYGDNQGSYRSYYSPDGSRVGGYEESEMANDSVVGKGVLISMRVPADAQVTFDGEKTKQTGTFRQFLSPALEGKGPFTYQIKVSWTENGAPVTRTRSLNVQPGQRLMVNMMQPNQMGTQTGDRMRFRDRGLRR